MKNIYIIGIPRAGKTTLAKLIKNTYPEYNQITFEAVRNGFIESQPELNMNNRNSDARKKILPTHLVTFAKWNNKITNIPTLIEGSFCNIETLCKLVDKEDIIICLGSGCRNKEQIVDNVIKYDTENDYTKSWSKEKIMKHFYNIDIEDKENFNYCKDNNIKYYDTFTNRESIFDEILNFIVK